MPQHRETTSSISVRDLLGQNGGRSTRRHRAEPRTSDRVKLAATAAMAAGTLVGSGAGLAHASVLPTGKHTADSADDITLKSAAAPAPAVDRAYSTGLPIVPAVASTKGADVASPSAPTLSPSAPALSPSAPALSSQQNPDRASLPDPAPFGLRNLPPQAVAPLAQAEQVIKVLQLITPSPQTGPNNSDISPADGGNALPRGAVLQNTSWGVGK